MPYKTGTWGIQAKKRQKKRIIRGDRKKELITAKEKVFKRFGYKCFLCGFNDFRALQIDHINNDGFLERKINSTVRYKKVLKDTTGKYQLLCANCNWIKRYEFKKEKELEGVNN